MSDPIRYIERTRAYYLALGYETPYRWASNASIPFCTLPRPVSEARIALVTTAAPYQPDKGDQGPGAAYNGAAKFFTPYQVTTDSDPDLRISHIGYDRTHTTARDPGTWLPLAALQRAVAAGRIAGLTRHLFGLPTNRSQATTIERDAPLLLDMLRNDGADAALLVPNCPVCHQSVTLAARHLEQNGIATAIMGCARDIVEQVGAPRFVFSDFPLGNSAGRPDDPASQDLTVELALKALETATEPGETVVSPLTWPGPDGWKLDYSNPDKLSAGELQERRKAFDAAKVAARASKSQAMD